MTTTTARAAQRACCGSRGTVSSGRSNTLGWTCASSTWIERQYQLVNDQHLQHAYKPYTRHPAELPFSPKRVSSTSPGSLAFLLVLPRALEFMMAIMGRLLEKPEMSMSEVVYEQYHQTLSKWHGFWATSAFNVSRG